MFERMGQTGSSGVVEALGPVPTRRNGESSTQGTLVLSLGNPLRGDDGVGGAILEALVNAPELPESVALLDGYRGGLMNALLRRECERVIIVDAALLGLLPGAWKRFTLHDVRLNPVDLSACRTLHNASLAEAMALAETLDIDLPEIIIYGVQPQEMGWSLGLSEAVRKVIPEVYVAILEDLTVFREDRSQNWRRVGCANLYKNRKDKYHGEDTSD